MVQVRNRNRNRNLTKVGTGTGINSYGSAELSKTRCVGARFEHRTAVERANYRPTQSRFIPAPFPYGKNTQEPEHTKSMSTWMFPCTVYQCFGYEFRFGIRIQTQSGQYIPERRKLRNHVFKSSLKSSLAVAAWSSSFLHWFLDPKFVSTINFFKSKNIGTNKSESQLDPDPDPDLIRIL